MYRFDRMRGGFRRGAAAAAAVLALFAPLSALAGDAQPPAAKKTVAEQLLDIMRAKNVIDEEQYQALLEQARQEAAERSAPAVAAAPPEPAKKPEWEFAWKNGFRLTKSDGSADLKFGGFTQNDFAVVNESRNLESLIGGVGTGTEFRRARIMFEGSMYEYAIFKAEYDFAEGEPDFKDVWAGLQKIPYVDRVRVGYMKEPFSLEQMTSDRYTTFMERALPDVFSPARNTGIMVDRTFLDERIYVGAGGFVKTNNFGKGFQNGSNNNLTARITGLPLYVDEGKMLIHVGGSYSHLFRDDAGLTYKQRPESHLAPYITNTGTISGVDGVDLAGGELAGVFGPFHFQSEAAGSFVDRSQGLGNPRFWGAYAQAGWFLTGEVRPYETRNATFGRVIPKHPFSVKNGTWGGWEIAARYSYLTLDDENVAGGTVSDVTGGINWYLYPNLRLAFNYVYSHRNDVGDANIAESRIQIDF